MIENDTFQREMVTNNFMDDEYSNHTEEYSTGFEQQV